MSSSTPTLDSRSISAHKKLAKYADNQLTSLAVFQCNICMNEFKFEGLYAESVRIIDGERHANCTGKLILIDIKKSKK
jgi:hypothetical protein